MASIVATPASFAQRPLTGSVSSRDPSRPLKLTVAAALGLLSGAIIPLLEDPALDRGVGGGTSLILRAVPVLVFMVLVAVALPALPDIMSRLCASPHIPVVLLVGAASVIWSSAPKLAARTAIGLAGATLVGSYLASRFDTTSLLDALRAMWWFTLVASFVFIVAFPELGLMPEGTDSEGAWRGIFLHKNILGRMMVLSALTFLLSFKHQKRSTFAIGLGASALAVWGSSSITSMSLLISLLAVLPLLLLVVRLGRERLLLLLLAMIGATLLASVTITHWGTILSAMGRDYTLTGRTMLWEKLVPSVQTHIYTGHGLGTFWVGEGTANEVTRAVGWSPAHSHNGFVDMALELGLPILIIFLAGFHRAVGRAFRRATQDSSTTASWPLLYLLFLGAANLAESSLLRNPSIMWTLYTFAVLTVAGPPSIARASAPARGHT